MNAKTFKALILLWASMPAHGVSGQDSETTPIRVSDIAGRVIETTSRAPISGALIVLSPRPQGALVFRAEGRGVTSLLRTATDESGTYRFSDLPRGTYTLQVSHVGYEAATIQIALESDVATRVTVGLVVDPIELEPITILDAGAQPLARARVRSTETGSAAAVRLRQLRYLESDVRTLTPQSVDAAITLVEPDLFRAFQRLPGVSVRDEFLAEPWVRAAPWGRVRTYLDGVPLFDPLHLGGFLTAVPPEAVGAAFLHMGVRPAEIAEGSAAVINFALWEARERAVLPLEAEMTIAGIRAATERRFLGGRAGIVLGGRRSVVDRAVALAGDNDPEGPFSYVLSSWFLHGDVKLSDDSELSFMRLSASDKVEGNVMSLIRDTEARWGSDLGQLTLRSRVGEQVRAKISVATSDFTARIRPASESGITPIDPDVVRLSPGQMNIDYRSIRMSIEDAVSESMVGTWAGGLDAIEQGLLQVGGSIGDGPTQALLATEKAELRYVSAWGRARLSLGERWQLEGALRANFHSKSIRGTGRAALAPGITVRGELTGWTVSASIGRSFLYAQQVSSAGTAFGPAWHVGHRWVLADEASPVQKTDVISLGGERWVTPTWLLSLTGFGRSSAGVALGGPEVSQLRTSVEFHSERAVGFEALIRKASRPAYAFGRLRDGLGRVPRRQVGRDPGVPPIAPARRDPAGAGGQASAIGWGHHGVHRRTVRTVDHRLSVGPGSEPNRLPGRSPDHGTATERSNGTRSRVREHRLSARLADPWRRVQLGVLRAGPKHHGDR